jgi:beta-glucanase (GH16 family)
MKPKPIYLTLIVLGCLFFQLSYAAVPQFATNGVVAHRGAWKKLKNPENSLAALRQAIALGCAGSEFDVRMSSDNQLVVNHDAEYNGMMVEETPYKKLAAVKLPNGETLPLLEAFLREGIKNNPSTRLFCEIKPVTGNTERGKLVARQIIKLVKSLKVSPYMVYISFDYDILKEILRLDPKANTQYLGGDKPLSELRADGIGGADYHYSVFDAQPELIEQAKSLQLAINTWTINDTWLMDQCLVHAFDYITTNEPELLLSKINTSPLSKGWKLVWYDEFNKNGLPEKSKWTCETGGHGWGNNELQYYTDFDSLNAWCENGNLKITARKLPKEGKDYTSARLVTRGKYEFTYGKVEVRAMLPQGRGTWPAIWMLGSNIHQVGWPDCGEIDIMEHVGYMKDSIFGTIHTKAYNHVIGTQKVKSIAIEDPYNEFHVFSVEWTPQTIDFLMDGKVYNHITNEHKTIAEWPFDLPQYIILNLAIGGNWGGSKGVDTEIFPAELVIDYVRVYQN